MVVECRQTTPSSLSQSIWVQRLFLGAKHFEQSENNFLPASQGWPSRHLKSFVQTPKHEVLNGALKNHWKTGSESTNLDTLIWNNDLRYDSKALQILSRGRAVGSLNLYGRGVEQLEFHIPGRNTPAIVEVIGWCDYNLKSTALPAAKAVLFPFLVRIPEIPDHSQTDWFWSNKWPCPLLCTACTADWDPFHHRRRPPSFPAPHSPVPPRPAKSSEKSCPSWGPQGTSMDYMS